MAGSRITLKRNVIGHPQNQCATVRVLGLDKANSTVTKPANEATRGMVNTISYLMDVEEV